MAAVMLPGVDDLDVAPERAALALLDAALAVARASVLAQNPDVAILGDPSSARDPPHTAVLAARLAARAVALRDLIAAYLDAVHDLGRDDSDLPF